MLCPRCQKKLFRRQIVTNYGVEDDEFCLACSYSRLGSQDMNAQAEHDAELAELVACSVAGCPNKITAYCTPNEWGMCYECAHKHRAWLEGGRSKYSPFRSKGKGRWVVNTLAGQWKDRKLKSQILKRQIEYCEQ